MTADSGGFTPEQLRAAAEDFLDRLEIGYRDQDEREATAWVVEVVDPVLRPGGYGYRRLLGPHTDRSAAEAEAERIRSEVNPFVAVDGSPPLNVSVQPVFAELR